MAQQTDSVIAVFPDHRAADAAVARLIESGFDMHHFSSVSLP